MKLPSVNYRYQIQDDGIPDGCMELKVEHRNSKCDFFENFVK